MKKLLIFAPAVFSAALLLGASTAMAANKVSSPDVTKGQIELEYRGGYDFDDTSSRDGQQTHRFVGNYGITDRWRTEFKLNLQGDSDDLDWTYLEWSNRYQIFKEGEAWLRLAIQENYKLALQDGSPDRFEITVLAAKDIGATSHVTNINFENQLGDNAVGGTNFNVSWKSKYRYQPNLEPGFEFYGDFGRIGSPSSKSPDRFFLGPVLSGKLDYGIKYDVGYLFGMDADAADGRLKMIFTYAF